MQKLWQLELDFWQGAEATYEANLAEECVIIVPVPNGILDRVAAIELIKTGGRWTEVEMTEQRALWAASSIVLIAYKVKASKAGDSKPYTALCSSTYYASESGWRMVAHQQTPIQ